jgi:antirestriction protein
MTTTKNIKTEAKIFLTDYASYNEGTQFELGHWVNLEDFEDAEELNEYINTHFSENGIEDPEVMITDFEGFPEQFYSESMNFENLYNYFERAEDCAFEVEIIEAFASLGNYNVEDTDQFFDALEESYSGTFDSDEDFAEDMAEQIGFEQSNVWPHNCIDWERAARDLMYDYSESNGHYFRSI